MFRGYDHAVGIWFQEQDEELLLDRIDRNAPVANRPLDKGSDFVLGVVEQKLVARAHRNIDEGDKRITGCSIVIAGKSLHVPFWLEKELTDVVELLRGELIRNVGLV